ncbi:chromatin assembly complex protein [Coprinopsis sp. MPI-PUGE-AT-0042]|nr:chromatin assembly complex protein [Coprinopsis sp. MPI-PUGE-AT-0042]
MRFRTLEIRWHDSKPISTCDFQPVPFKKARPPAGQDKNYAGHAYRLATGGEDNHVRLWMVHPHIRPTSVVDEADQCNGPRAPRVEYLATLSRHSAAVNVVRFSPNGECIASAGDDGMIIIWAPSSSPQAATYGSDLSTEDLQHEKEYWKPRTSFRCTQMQVYDLAWSPTCEYIIAGSTDNTARVFSAADGKCVYEIAEHSHFVQGVAWDPMNEYIATQSSDRSMHIYRISTKNGSFEAHAVGKNTRMPHRHSRTPSHASRSHHARAPSQSDTESVIMDDASADAPPTPAMSVHSTPSMFPPPSIEASSRRSSFSGSNAPGSPSTFSRYGRSPSPMPPLPAIRSNPWSNIKLYGDESYTNFFRRLTFSPDGGLLLTPAGQFEDPTVNVPSRGRKGKPTGNDAAASSSTEKNSTASSSSVFIYSRANFARPPIAQLPGHKKASVAVRFSPVLFELRSNVEGGEETKTAALERGLEGSLKVDLTGPTVSEGNALLTPQRTQSLSAIDAPAPKLSLSTSTSSMSPVKASPAPSPMDLQPPTPRSKPPTPSPSQEPPMATPKTGAIFSLPYRMLYAVVTMDTVAVYDTQQAGPVALLTKLHYDEFTDMTWSPDGQCLMLSSRDGYCTIIIFDEILAAHHTQQHTLQMQSIAQHHSVPLLTSTSSSGGLGGPSTGSTPAATPLSASIGLPPFAKRVKDSAEPPLTPAASVDGGDSQQSYFGSAQQEYHPKASSSSSSAAGPSASASGLVSPSASVDVGPSASTSEVEREPTEEKEPPKKKRRVALTKVSDLGA